MSFVDAIKTCFQKYVDFNGRARRSEYWWFNLFVGVVSGVLMMLGKHISFFGILSTVFGLATLIPSLSVTVRRFHDIGKRWPWILISLIPVVGLILCIVWTVKDSDPGDNMFGPNPKGL